MAIEERRRGMDPFESDVKKGLTQDRFWSPLKSIANNFGQKASIMQEIDKRMPEIRSTTTRFPPEWGRDHFSTMIVDKDEGHIGHTQDSMIAS